MRIKVTFELDTEKLGNMNKVRKRFLLLSIEESLQRLKDIGEVLDAHDGSLCPNYHYTEECNGKIF